MLSTLKSAAAATLAALTVAGGLVIQKQINRPERARACFFIGSHTYYALPPDESVDADENQEDPFKSHDEFIKTMLPDSVVTDFVRALHEKEEHIFVSYSTFNSFIKLIQRIEAAFAHYGVEHPLSQLSVDGATIISTAMADSFTKTLAVVSDDIKNNAQDANNTVDIGYPAFTVATKHYASPSATHVQQGNRTAGAKTLSPAFCRVFHFLLALNDTQWNIYDTKKGLLYLTPRINKPETAIDTQRFTKLTSFTYPSHTNRQSLSDRLLVYQPQTDLADENIWVENIAAIIPTDKKTEWCFFFTGHGSPMLNDGKKLVERIKKQEGSRYLITQAVICGMKAYQFKKVLTFLHTHLKTNRVFVCSCYVTAQRLHGLVSSKINAFNYELITPIATMIPSTQYVPRVKIKKYHVIDDNTRHMEYQISDNNNPGIKKFADIIQYSDRKTLLGSIDMVYSLKENKAISILPAQSKKSIVLSA